MPSYPELAGRVVVITGAAQGIGAVTARAFAGQRANVALLDIDEPRMREVAAGIAGSGARAVSVRVDVTDDKSVDRAIAATVAEFGGIDVLINCAGGYGRLTTIEDISVDEWDQTVALNLRSVFLCCRAAIPILKRSKAGRIMM